MKKNNTSFTSKDLKENLWKTLKDVRAKKMAPVAANAVATQAREIMRVVKTELQVANHSGMGPSKEVGEFTGISVRPLVRTLSFRSDEFKEKK